MEQGTIAFAGDGIVLTNRPYVREDGEEMWELETAEGKISVQVRAIRSLLEMTDNEDRTDWNEVKFEKLVS